MVTLTEGLRGNWYVFYNGQWAGLLLLPVGGNGQQLAMVPTIMSALLFTICFIRLHYING